jgi:hypothetical protein
MAWINIDDVSAVQAGDVADHKSGELDPRRVAKVEPGFIWLEVGEGAPIGPFDWGRYTYQRQTEV